jgi:hypothetical protein
MFAALMEDLPGSFVSVFWTRIAFFLKMFALCLLISALTVDLLALTTSSREAICDYIASYNLVAGVVFSNCFLSFSIFILSFIIPQCYEEVLANVIF